MSQIIFPIHLEPDRNLPWYTIVSETTIQKRYIRQTSGPGHFAMITLKIEPDRGE